MRALVIKTYGDAEVAGAIVDGITRTVEPLEVDELAAVKAELARLKLEKRLRDSKDGVRAYGDAVRWETACRALAVKYHVEPVGPVYGAILGAWAALWMFLHTAIDHITEGRR